MIPMIAQLWIIPSDTEAVSSSFKALLAIAAAAVVVPSVFVIIRGGTGG